MYLLNRIQRHRANYTWMIVSLLWLLPCPSSFVYQPLPEILPSDPRLPSSGCSFSKTWKPGSGRFGFYPFIVGSIWVTLLAMLLSAPICLLTAIYVTQYTRKRFLRIMHPAIDILAGLPSVVYGLWGILVIVPFISRYVGPLFHVQTLGYSILAAALVLSIMIIPFILNILIEIFRTIPVELKEASMDPWVQHSGKR